jgi:hypothetical protein
LLGYADASTGGQVRVSHKGVERFFDFGSNVEDNSSIQWAVFYSDCEHEVLPVTSGHRITLTYKLYVSEHLGGIFHPQFPTADPKLYPLFQSISSMLSSLLSLKTVVSLASTAHTNMPTLMGRQINGCHTL